MNSTGNQDQQDEWQEIERHHRSDMKHKAENRYMNEFSGLDRAMQSCKL